MRRLWIGLTYVVFIILLIIPLSRIAIGAFEKGLDGFMEGLLRPEALHALMMTGFIVVLVTLLNALFGIMMALYLVRANWLSRKIKSVLNSIVDLPYAVSPVIGGLMIVLLLGPDSIMGGFFEGIGFKVVYAFPGMVIATLFVTFPLMVREVMPVLQEIGHDQEQAAATLGAYGWTTFRKVTWPSIRWAVVYGIVLTVARSLGEFGAVLVVSGNIMNKTQTATTLVYQDVENFNVAAANGVALVLAAFSIGILLLMEWAKKEGVCDDMHVEVRDLNKHFGTFHAVKNVSFEIEKGHLIGLLGPSGGGKTSILRMLAGLENPDSGQISFHGQVVNDLPPQERGIGFVFQNYALFKHMTVFDNIAFGLKVKKIPKAQIKERVMELVELTGLKGFESRYPHQLSGGQRQRVAFARALAPEPQLLLLDEPFAAIDAKIRQELRSWLRELIERVGITSIFVTHDQDEAIEVADEIMIINQGRVEQKGTPWDIYKEPKTPFVASFIGESTVISSAAELKGFEAAANKNATRALIRPEYIEIGSEHDFRVLSATETGIVRHLHFRGSEWLVEVEVKGHKLVTYRSLEKETLHPGQEVRVLVHRAYLFNEEHSWIEENRLKVDPMPIMI